MPSWKKIITSGSDAVLNSLFINTSITASIVSGSQFTGSLFGTASWANNALTSSNILGGAVNYIPLWNTDTSLSSSIIYQSGSRIAIGAGATLPGGILVVKGAGATNSTKTLILQNSTPRDTVTVFDNGNVGIGYTTDIGYNLDVSGSFRADSVQSSASLFTYGAAVGAPRPLRIVGLTATATNVNIQIGNVNTNNSTFSGSSVLVGSRNTYYDGATTGLFIYGNLNTAETPAVGILMGSGNYAGVFSGQHIVIGNANSSSAYTNTQATSIVIGQNNNTNGFYGGGLFGSSLKYYANRQLAFGANSSNVNFSISDVFFGFGVRNENTTVDSNNGHGPNVAIHPSWAADAADKIGGNLTLAGGRGTGTGSAGDVIIATSTASGSTGTVLQTLSNRILIKGSTGNLIVGSVTGLDTGSFRLNVSGSGNFVGGLITSGSFTVFTGSGVEFQVTNTGTKIGNVITDAHTVTGSINVSGSITSSLFGTASWASNVISASFASTASFVVSASRATTASFALTSSTILGGTTNYIPIWNSPINLGSSQIFQTSSALTSTAGYYDISFYLTANPDGSAAILFRGIDKPSLNPKTQINHINSGTSSFVNYGFYNETGSGFYGLSGSNGTVRLAFNNTDKFEFSSSGLFRAADDVVGFYSFSDRRLKYDIKPVCGSLALDQVQQLQGVYYKWVGNEGSRSDREEIGLIAQDVEKIIPQLVREQERLGQGTYKTVDYEHLTALLIEAVKEQQKQIDELKAKIDGLTK